MHMHCTHMYVHTPLCIYIYTYYTHMYIYIYICVLYVCNLSPFLSLSTAMMQGACRDVPGGSKVPRTIGYLGFPSQESQSWFWVDTIDDMDPV